MNKIRVRLILLAPVAYILTLWAQANPLKVELLYSRDRYLRFAGLLSRATGVLPFSLGELITVATVVVTIWTLARAVKKAFRGSPGSRVAPLAGWLSGFIAAACGVWLLFFCVWGANYYRMPLAGSIGLEVRERSLEDLARLCRTLIGRANVARAIAGEDSQTVVDILGRAALGYDVISGQGLPVGGQFGRPKAVFLSRAMTWAGISGVYFPYTCEANVDAEQMIFMIPSTALHEMAHQRGFAREDEANYLAYRAGIAHPDADFQYSGLLLAAIHAMNALYDNDRALYRQLYALYSDGVKRDLKAQTDFWRQYEGPVERASTRINDTYLKSQGQKAGVASYGRMVDLLLAELVPAPE
jgi:hypothetical protein